ncbi:MAG: hypothetical protein K2Q20_06550 [Phycisphaerales bacterium]|nr:hypothetical protein [Phycisphaerales bacterium]
MPDQPRSRRVASLARPLCSSMLVCVWLAALSACTTSRDPNLAGPDYPVAKAQGQTLDIQVVRGETALTLTNTTARSFGRSRLWVNRWYSREIEALEVGQSLELDLDSFRDIYGEAFRAGGFFATRKPDRVELVQLETADTMLGLVAVGRVEE